jgi:hypothetical protein
MIRAVITNGNLGNNILSPPQICLGNPQSL